MHDRIAAVVGQVGTVLLGKEMQVRLALACLLARGHLLIEDLPGMGKTMLSHALARSLGLRYSRIQFTSDILPADILGASIFDRTTGRFEFQPGPIFAEVVLADEINRTTPRSQSALLEAMEEGQVTIEGHTHDLPRQFFVIATQNPVTQSGTFPLPESQLDRFLMRIELGYPDPQAERELLRGSDRRAVLADLQPRMTPDELLQAQQKVRALHFSDALLDYVQRIVARTRRDDAFAFGLSPRGALALLRAAQAWAFIDGRSHVVPEDVQTVLPGVVVHRLRARADHAGHGGAALVRGLLADVDVIA